MNYLLFPWNQKKIYGLTRFMLEAKFGDDHPWRHYHLVRNLSKVNNKDAGMTEIRRHSSVFIVNFKQTLLDIKFEQVGTCLFACKKNYHLLINSWEASQHDRKVHNDQHITNKQKSQVVTYWVPRIALKSSKRKIVYYEVNETLSPNL